MSLILILLATAISLWDCTLADNQEWNHGSAEYNSGGNQQQIEYEFHHGHAMPSKSAGRQAGFASASSFSGSSGSGAFGGGGGQKMMAAFGKAFAVPQEQEFIIGHGVGGSSGTSSSLNAMMGSQGLAGKGFASARGSGFLSGLVRSGSVAPSGSAGGNVFVGENGQEFETVIGKGFAGAQGQGFRFGHSQRQMPSPFHYKAAFPRHGNFYPVHSFENQHSSFPAFANSGFGMQQFVSPSAPAPFYPKFGLDFQQLGSQASDFNSQSSAINFQHIGAVSGPSFPKSEVIYQQQGPGIPIYGPAFSKYGLSFTAPAISRPGPFAHFPEPAPAPSVFSSEKPGSCPSNAGVIGICVYQCKSDMDCSGNKKCCSTGCGTYCARPPRKSVY